MNRVVFLIIPALICGMMFTSCGSDNADSQKGKLQYVETEFGGCNGIKSALLSDDSETEEGEDKIVISVLGESVHVLVGLNYICCAPFETKIETKDDILHMYIIDACNFGADECYCRCHCYYTFDFVFNYQGKVNQKYKVLLVDPRNEEHVVISEGTISVGNE